jgi:hypothetical protein
MSEPAESMARVLFIFIENYEIENVVIYFQKVREGCGGAPLWSETLIVGSWYSIKPDLAL